MRGRSERWWVCLRPGLTLPVPVDPLGRLGPTPSASRGPRWRRTSRGLFVRSSIDGSVPEQRIVEAASTLPGDAGITGWAALRWQGAAWFDGLAPDTTTRLPIPLALGRPGVVAQPGFVVSQEFLRAGDLIFVDGLPVTIPVRSATYEMRHARDVRTAAVALDMAAYQDLVSIDEATAYTVTLRIWTGVPQCRAALTLADENAWSPPEARLRMVWLIDAELPPPRCNRPVFDKAGGVLGVPDLLDEEAGVVIEYDGPHHIDVAQRRRDRDREEVFRRHGLEYLTVLGPDMADRERLAGRLHEIRARARWQPVAERSWTTELPSWWVPTFTVDQRRDLDPAARERLLRLRRTVLPPTG